MKTGTKEFYELMAQFEKDVTLGVFSCSSDFRKESADLNKVGAFYCNGTVNAMFIAYMHGYSFRRSLE